MSRISLKKKKKKKKEKIALYTSADLIYNKRVHLSAGNIFTIISTLGFLIRVQVVPFFPPDGFPVSGSPLAPVVFHQLPPAQLLFLKALTHAPCF